MNLKYLKQEAAQQMWGYLWTFLVWLLIFSTVECIRMYYNFQNQMFTGSKPTVSTKFAKAYQRMSNSLPHQEFQEAAACQLNQQFAQYYDFPGRHAYNEWSPLFKTYIHKSNNIALKRRKIKE